MLQENSLSFSVIDAALLGKLLVGQAEPIGRGFSWLKSWHPHRPKGNCSRWPKIT